MGKFLQTYAPANEQQYSASLFGQESEDSLEEICRESKVATDEDPNCALTAKRRASARPVSTCSAYPQHVASTYPVIQNSANFLCM